MEWYSEVKFGGDPTYIGLFENYLHDYCLGNDLQYLYDVCFGSYDMKMYPEVIPYTIVCSFLILSLKFPEVTIYHYYDTKYEDIYYLNVIENGRCDTYKAYNISSIHWLPEENNMPIETIKATDKDIEKDLIKYYSLAKLDILQ